MSGLSLYQMTADYLAAMDDLRNLDMDEQALADTIEGLTGELAIKGANVAAFALNLEAEADALRAAEKRMAERRKALEKKAEAMRAYLLSNMQAAEIKEIKALDGSFRARVMAGRDSVHIDDEAKIPVEYLRVKKEVDKTLISQALKDGYDVPGVHLERKASLKID